MAKKFAAVIIFIAVMAMALPGKAEEITLEQVYTSAGERIAARIVVDDTDTIGVRLDVTNYAYEFLDPAALAESASIVFDEQVLTPIDINILGPDEQLMRNESRAMILTFPNPAPGARPKRLLLGLTRDTGNLITLDFIGSSVPSFQFASSDKRPVLSKLQVTATFAFLLDKYVRIDLEIHNSSAEEVPLRELVKSATIRYHGYWVSGNWRHPLPTTVPETLQPFGAASITLIFEPTRPEMIRLNPVIELELYYGGEYLTIPWGQPLAETADLQQATNNGLLMVRGSRLIVDASSWIRVVGEIVNNGSRTLDSIEVTVTLYGEGNVVADTDSTVVRNLRPGQAKPFNILIRDPGIKVESYKVTAEEM